MADDHMTLNSTVADLVALIDRTKKSLCEAGEPELAERAMVTVMASGAVRMSFCGNQGHGTESGHATVEKALSIDPKFRKAV